MGNFSRNTFDPVKDYVAVRLQQGVPLLDADWNELNDVARQELYDAFSLTFTDGVPPHGFDFEVKPRQEPNDFSILAGAALIQGRPIRVRQNLRYSTQPWTDPRLAARDGVDEIPRLTTPPGPAGAPDRTDIVYLDVWDREVGSVEDANLINPAIGVETCVRLKREAAVRVTEGATTLPTNVPAGHVFLPLALLHRPPNQREITKIESIRPFFHSPQGAGVVSFFPGFLPIYSSPLLGPSLKLPEWRIMFLFAAGGGHLKFGAIKEMNEAATGVLPLLLPDGARLSSFSINGQISAVNGQILWQLLRINHQVPTEANAAQLVDVLAEANIRAVLAPQLFSPTTVFPAEQSKLIVDNGRYYYALLAQTVSQPAYGVRIDGISISYQPGK